MKYVAYDTNTGKVFYFYTSITTLTDAPDNLALLQVSDEVNGSYLDTHKVVNGALVLNN